MSSISFENMDGQAAKIEVELNLIEFKEDNVHHVYSPELDLSAYGYSISEARKSFQIILEETMNHALKHGSFEKWLKKNGWSKEKKKGRGFTQGPFDAFIKANKNMQKVLNEKQFSRKIREVTVPITA